MFFDINEIQIQVGVLFNNEKCIVFNSSSSQNIIYNIYTKKFKKKQKKTQNDGLPFENFRKFWLSDMEK